jgi:hypothetical protein
VRAEVTLGTKTESQRLFRETNIRGYQTNVELNFHGDGSDALFFLCARQGRSGGTTRLSSATTAFNDLIASRPDLADVLQLPFYFDTRGETGDSPYQISPIFVVHAGLVNILYKRGYIELAQRLPGVPALSDIQIEAMDALDRALRSEKNCFEFAMAPGDILIANNYNILHARTQFEDWPAPAPGRLMLRIWSTLKRNRRPLPAPFRTSREFRESHKRRVALGDAV